MDEDFRDRVIENKNDESRAIEDIMENKETGYGVSKDDEYLGEVADKRPGHGVDRG